MNIRKFLFPLFAAIVIVAIIAISMPRAVYAACGLPGQPKCPPSGGNKKPAPTDVPISTPTLTPVPSASLPNPNGINPNGVNGNGIDSNGVNNNGVGSNGIDDNGVNSNGVGSNGLDINGGSPLGILILVLLIGLLLTGGVLAMRFVFPNIFTTKIDWSSGHGDETPKESISMNYEEIGADYKLQHGSGKTDEGSGNESPTDEGAAANKPPDNI